MKRSVLGFCIVVGLCLVIVCYGGWRLYQDHLSSDLKRTLTAAADPSATEADLHVYIRDARLQVRTRKDKAVLGEFEKVVQLAQDAEEQHELYWEQVKGSLRELTDGSCMRLNTLPFDEEIVFRNGKREPSLVRQRLQDQCAEESKRDKVLEAAQDNEEKREDEDRKTAKNLYSQFRADLGLPPPVER